MERIEKKGCCAELLKSVELEETSMNRDVRSGKFGTPSRRVNEAVSFLEHIRSKTSFTAEAQEL
jgi:hypothetical protein